MLSLLPRISLAAMLILAVPYSQSTGEHLKNRAITGWSDKELREWTDAAVSTSPGPKMKFKVRVPSAGKRPGDVIDVTLPNGEERQLTLPDHAQPGKMLQVEVPTAKPKNPDWTDVDGRSLLLIAALMNNVECTRILIAREDQQYPPLL